ncbi:MAG: cobalamin biosynthesis protein CobG [Silicimonas sp.]|nr:cobalamin biosynthesis protein CobG [Silicimonas sp.]
MTWSVKGWCPSAYRPMSSGDGLILRIKPRLGRITVDEALLLADLAECHGNGLIDVTMRGNLQLRGLSTDDHGPVLDTLLAEGLIDSDPLTESRRAMVVTPLWTEGDLTERLGRALIAALPDLPDLPEKMGYALDTGPARLLNGVPGDARFESGETGLILRADGASTGVSINESNAMEALADLLGWFTDSGGSEAGRMARHLATTELPARFQGAEPGPEAPALTPGMAGNWPVVGVAFGAMSATDLAGLIAATKPTHIRVTPWRALVLEGGTYADHPGFVTDPSDPILRATACPGAPACSSASVETRDLATQLAPRMTAPFHVSGCAKGCAHPRPAPLTFTGEAGHFGLVKNGRASDTPVETGLTPADLMERFS